MRALVVFFLCIFAAFGGALEDFDSGFYAANKSQRLALHQRLKSIYVKSIINDDSALRARVLRRLIISCEALNLASADYRKELAAMGVSTTGLTLESIKPKPKSAAAAVASAPTAKEGATKSTGVAKTADTTAKPSGGAKAVTGKKTAAAAATAAAKSATKAHAKAAANNSSGRGGNLRASGESKKPAVKPTPPPAKPSGGAKVITGKKTVAAPVKPAAKPTPTPPAKPAAKAHEKIYLTAAHAHSKNGRAGVLLKFSAPPQKPAASSFKNTAILSLPAALDIGRKRFSAGASITVAQFDPQTVRISATAAKLPEIAYEMGKNEIFVYVKTATKTAAASKKPAAKPTAAAKKPAKTAAAKSSRDDFGSRAHASSADRTRSSSSSAAVRASQKGARADATARSKLLIVIDAGHGGKDAGASAHGRSEKHITLAIAKQLSAALRSRGYATKLTRTRDEFITLRGRTKIANDARADLFISIHANSLADAKRRAKVHGIETYFLSPARSERSKNAAAAENKSDIEEMNYFSKQTFLNFLNREKIIASNKLAIDIQAGMLGALRAHKVRDGGVKEAPFWVLVGAQMPAVLVEVGYITHPQEGANIASASYQKHLARGIATGVENYFLKNKFF